MSLFFKPLPCIFILTFLCFAQQKNTYATLDSLVGTAQVQRAGTQDWKPMKVGDKLYNNDVIRVLVKSHARLGWPDQSASFMQENSQLMLTFYENTATTIISRHITVVYGAVFFIIREVLPKTLIKQYDTKIFTPTSVVSLRGTSFSVTLDKNTKTSTVKVINGTVQYKNIKGTNITYVSAGFKSTVETDNDPISPKTVMDKEIDSLKMWVPAPVIDLEMSLQLAKASRDHDIISGTLKDKLILIPLVNSSKYTGPWNIQSGLAQMLGDQLKAGNLTVELLDTSSEDVYALGQKQNARFVLSGEITDFDISQQAEVSAAADEYKEYYIAKVHMRVQLFSVAQKQVVFDETFSSDMKGKNTRENSWSKTSKMTFSISDKQFSKSLLGSAITQVIEQATERIMKIIKYE
jgi:hypothetical protein